MSLLKEIQELGEISTAVAHRPDFVQGGGGNTSVKAYDGNMVIKASGFELKEISNDNGFTVVNGVAIADYFRQIETITDAVSQEKASVEFIRNKVVPIAGLSTLRPSMETGFHSLLQKYVIHTHSVYSNIINCSTEAQSILEKVFATENIKPLFIEYCNPGFELSVILCKKSRQYKIDHGSMPQVIFLQNHGLIVSSDEKEEVIELHKKTNQVLMEKFSTPEKYPEIKLEQLFDNTYKCTSEYIIGKFIRNNPSQEFFDRVLFPDQTVFFNNNFSFRSDDALPNKININTITSDIIYKTGHKEARTIQETLTAYFYILEQIEANQYTPGFINQSDVNRINTMESEKYRKDLLK